MRNNMKMKNLLDKRPPTTSSFMQCLKYIMAANFGIIAVGGCTVLGIGIWTMLTEYGGRQLSDMIGVHLYLIDSHILIVCGCLILLMTLVGSCGVMFEYKCLLGTHIGITAFLSITLIVGGSLGFAFRNELEESVRMKMELSLKKKYGISSSNGEETDLTLAWDSAQKSFQCCGVYGDINTTTSWAIYRDTHWYTEIRSKNESEIPPSCCKEEYLDICFDNQENMQVTEIIGPPVPLKVAKNLTFYTEGCFDKIVDELESNGLVIGIVAIVVSIFMIIEVILCVCMYRNIH